MIQLSPFWKELRGFLGRRFVVALLLIMLSFEGVALLAPYIVGRYVHQPFLTTSMECKTPFSNEGKRLTWITNDRGARGDLDHGQTVKIAVLGSSTAAGSTLDQDESWPERLKFYMGEDRVHVDNYARDGMGPKGIACILKHIDAKGRRYDILLLMPHSIEYIDDIEALSQKDEKDAFRYSSLWAVSGHICKAPGLLRRRIKRQLVQEHRVYWLYLTMYRSLQAIKRWLMLGSSGLNVEEATFRKTVAAQRALRNSGKIKFIDIPVVVDEITQQNTIRNIQKLIHLAKRVSSHVYFLTHPVAYDLMEHPGVAAKWYALQPVNDKNGCYTSNKTIALRIRYANSLLYKSVGEAGVDIIALDEYMRSLLHHRDDLFEDKWHFAPNGAKIAAQFIVDILDAKMVHTRIVQH